MCRCRWSFRLAAIRCCCDDRKRKSSGVCVSCMRSERRGHTQSTRSGMGGLELKSCFSFCPPMRSLFRPAFIALPCFCIFRSTSTSTSSTQPATATDSRQARKRLTQPLTHIPGQNRHAQCRATQRETRPEAISHMPRCRCSSMAPRRYGSPPPQLIQSPVFAGLH